ncbi:CaiB/BaiF CoA transferase family protein [Ferrimicrobium acidiphilum]|uniref:CaiB/BaiF CoA transferase family protein n=1 Tax=Ferrimicrobium acidiphilum TaxID=121039 RepID=UPI0023F2474C|nr:CaiB/BaiF CoA-transferase family protein [Ferrimicrobium acidiphilum]
MGPLQGIRVVEMAGIGPAPFAGMMLADLGATVIRIDPPKRPGIGADLMGRGKRAIAIDAKKPGATELILRIVDRSSILIEGFRPGVMERLGLGPEQLMAVNPRLIYGRMTGWGQEGSKATRSGHDINYISLSGVLGSIAGSEHGPTIPLNLVGDFGGGGMLLVAGVLAALIESHRTGRGQVVDAAMVDGSLLLMTMIYSMFQDGGWSAVPGGNLLDGGAPFYRNYRTKDDRWLAVGALEPQFFNELVTTLGVGDRFNVKNQYDHQLWPEMEAAFEKEFAGRSRSDWEEVFAFSDACVTPVLTMGESLEHPFHQERGSFVKVGGFTQPAPAPRFSHQTDEDRRSRPELSYDSRGILEEIGVDRDEADALCAQGLVIE